MLSLRWCQVPLEVWVQFEVRAAWGNVPVEVRQTYLYTYLVENVSLDQQRDKQSSEKPINTCHVVPLIFVLMEKGLLQVRKALFMQTSIFSLSILYTFPLCCI